MTELSLAAQSVINAAAQSVINAAVEAGGGCGRATPVLHARIAAALRAAATGLLVYQLDDPMMKTVLVVDADDLLAIANELEGRPND